MEPKYIRYASDMHLEGFLKTSPALLEEAFLPKDDRDAESILVLAGDICAFKDQLIGFIKYVEGRFLRVHYIPGNHEYYHYDFDVWNSRARAEMEQHLVNTTFATDDVVETCYGNFRIIQTTMWGDGGKNAFERDCVRKGLYDFSLIRKTEDGAVRAFTVKDMIELHHKQRARVEELLKTNWSGSTIVVTHHLPSYALCAPRFGTNENGGFASACDDLITQYSPRAWIHGHTHDTMETQVGNTLVVCNPRGYRREWNTEFNTYQAKFLVL
jgi:hypothetical protein